MKRKYLALVVLAAVTFSVAAGTPWTDKQTAAHEAAETLRAAGVEEESEAIQALKGLWWDEEAAKEKAAEKSETKAEAEATDAGPLDVYQTYAPWETYTANHPGYTCDWAGYCSLVWTVQQEVGYCDSQTWYYEACVILNRCEDWECPNDVYGVIAQPGQFSTLYLHISLPENVNPELVAVVDRALTETERTVPSNVFYAARGAMGSGVYAYTQGVTDGGYSWHHTYSYK